MDGAFTSTQNVLVVGHANDIFLQIYKIKKIKNNSLNKINQILHETSPTKLSYIIIYENFVFHVRYKGRLEFILICKLVRIQTVCL